MNDKGKLVLLVVVIAAALFFIFRPSSPPVVGRVLVDMDARMIFLDRVSAGEIKGGVDEGGRPIYEFPVSSPYSEGRNAYPGYECLNDGTLVLYSPPDIAASCPVCGEFNFKAIELQPGETSRDVPANVRIELIRF